MVPEALGSHSIMWKHHNNIDGNESEKQSKAKYKNGGNDNNRPSSSLFQLFVGLFI